MSEDGVFAAFTQQRRTRSRVADVAPSFDYSEVAHSAHANTDATHARCWSRWPTRISSTADEVPSDADGIDGTGATGAECDEAARSSAGASSFDFSSIADEVASDADGIDGTGATGAACDEAARSSAGASSSGFSCIADEVTSGADGIDGTGATGAACDEAARSSADASSFNFSSIADEVRSGADGIDGTGATGAACDETARSSAGAWSFNFSSIADEVASGADGIDGTGTTGAACDEAARSSAGASSFDFSSITDEVTSGAGGVAGTSSDLRACDSSWRFDYTTIVDEEARKHTEKTVTAFMNAYTTYATIPSHIDASIETGTRIAQATETRFPEHHKQDSKLSDAAAAGAVADGATAMAVATTSEEARIVAAAADAHNARTNDLYESLGRITAAAAVATTTAGAHAASEVSAIAQQHAETIAQMMAQNVLLQLECDTAHERASSLQAELTRSKVRRAEDLVTAVRCHDRDSALSALIAAEAEGNIDAAFVDMLNSAARRSNCKKRGSEATDAERAFYTSLFIVSREAARLISNLCHGPSLDRMEAWIKDYPHMQPGTTVASINSSLDAAIAVWRRVGVGMLNEDTEVYSCDDGSALQCRVNATMNNEQQLGVCGLVDGPYFVTLGELSDDQVMRMLPRATRGAEQWCRERRSKVPMSRAPIESAKRVCAAVERGVGWVLRASERRVRHVATQGV